MSKSGKKGPVSKVKEAESPYDKLVKRLFNGTERAQLLGLKKYIIIYNKNTFTCAECGDTCVCCDGARIYNSVAAIVAHMKNQHRVVVTPGDYLDDE